VIPDPAPNTITRPYRGLSVQEVDFRLTDDAVRRWLLGRDVYRRTEYLALRHGNESALVQVARETDGPLFTPVTEVRLLAGPRHALWVDSPETDVGNATALATAARAHGRAGVRAYFVRGRYEHVNFIWRPEPVRIRVLEVVPPEPPKLLAMAAQATAFDEDLPPIDLVADTVDIVDLARAHPSSEYLLPCRGSGAALPKPVSFLDAAPAERADWLLIGCERSEQFHHHFYGDVPPRVDICPRRRAESTGGGPALAKCCLLERGIEYSGDTAVVPWGANLDEVRAALHRLTGNPATPGGSP
jgi:hypothetical protein